MSRNVFSGYAVGGWSISVKRWSSPLTEDHREVEPVEGCERRLSSTVVGW